MRALVTGGTGFVGAHVVRRPVDRGHDVSVLVRLFPQGGLGRFRE